MPNVVVILFLFCFVDVVFLQGTGSGQNGNCDPILSKSGFDDGIPKESRKLFKYYRHTYSDLVRLCIVEGRGFKRATRYCTLLEQEKAGVECVLGTDRLDCLRRIHKGTVDFGVFSPEDLVAAQWADIEVLVTNEIRSRSRPYERTIVAVANRRILPDGESSLRAVLQNTSLCHPGVGVDDIRPMSDTLSAYLESLVLKRSCDPGLSLAENRIKALAEFFGTTCKAGLWVPDNARDAELKRKYPSLCSGCHTRCDKSDQYWGDTGALACLVVGGDVTWAELDDVRQYFGLTPKAGHASADRFGYLCRDGSWQPLDGAEPCVWLHRPWPVIVAKRKSAAAVAKIADTLTNGDVLVDPHWRGALAALLELRHELPEPLDPPVTALDYLEKAKGFREAYSQSGCQPPRHITLCTTSVLENNKCQWLSEAGAVYGIVPPLQCALRSGPQECLHAIQQGVCDVVVTNSDLLVRSMRDYSVVPVLHEVTPIVEKTTTVVAVVLQDSGIKDLPTLKNKRVSFPSYDGIAWHSALRYIMEKEKISCFNIKRYFKEICAPGIENYNVSKELQDEFTKNCYKEGGKVNSGELQALRAVVEGKSDVAFISKTTYNMYTAKLIKDEWTREYKPISLVCPEENKKYCFISWSNIGHILASTNITKMKRQEIINVFTKLDELFGKQHTPHNIMFSMYGRYNHEIDVLFHNNTKKLATDDMLKMHPYDKIPLNLERSLVNVNDSCRISSFNNGFGAKTKPTLMLVALSLVLSFVIVN